MKRYWKLITLTMVIILTFGTFYMQSTFATSKLPDFVIEHKSGDSTEIENFTINGLYLAGERSGAYFKLNKTGSTYDKPQSYIDMLRDDHLPAELKQLQKEYRSFMRGKESMHTSFSSNDEMLAYANININYQYTDNITYNDFTFEIETFNKQTKEKRKFTMPVPKPDDYEFIYVYDVQLTNSNELKVFTDHSIKPTMNHEEEEYGYNSRDEIHVYTFDLSKETLMNDEIIKLPEVEGDHQSTDIVIVSDRNYFNQSEYVVFKGIRSEEVVFDQQLITYHIDTGEQQTITLPEEIDERYSPYLYDEPIIYYTGFVEDQYHMIKYNVVDEKIEGKQTFDLNSAEDGLMPKIQIIDDKVYIVETFFSCEDSALIKVGNINTGEILYEGTIKKDHDYKEDCSVELYDIELDD